MLVDLGGTSHLLQGLRQSLVGVGVAGPEIHGHLEALDRLPPARLVLEPDTRLVMSGLIASIPAHCRRVQVRRAEPLLTPGTGGEGSSQIDVVAWVRRLQAPGGTERLL